MSKDIQALSTLSDEDVLSELASRKFERFVTYTKPDYILKWYHKKICLKLDDFLTGKIKRLILTMPPQHGKSELVSRRFPAYALGKEPDSKIVVASYSSALANTFNRDCQKVILEEKYQNVFPETRLSRQIKGMDAFAQTQSLFEVVGHTGFYKSVGVNGSLSGTPVDIGIIDDPFKDDKEASSDLIRERVWKWFLTVFSMRLHNDSRVLLTTTRWHEDDLVGRVIELQENDPDAPKYEVYNVEGLREDMISDPDDPRDELEALFPEKHNAEKMLVAKRNTPRIYYCIYQGKPAPDEGEILKSKWFDKVSIVQILREATEHNVDIVPEFFIDSAFTEDSKKNDPTVVMTTCKIGNFAYIMDVRRVWKEFPELIRFILQYVHEQGYTTQSRIFIEPKASGKSIAQVLRKKTQLNVIDDVTDFMNLQDDKVTRANSISADLEGRRMRVLDRGTWFSAFSHEIDHFPNGKHDDQVDVLVMATSRYFTGVLSNPDWRFPSE
jgi:predicted phage terminase large subunit-like protein